MSSHCNHGKAKFFEVRLACQAISVLEQAEAQELMKLANFLAKSRERIALGRMEMARAGVAAAI